MQTLILRSNNKEALKAIRTLADVLEIESSLKSSPKEEEEYIEKGVKIVRPKRAFDPKKMVGTLTDLNLQDPLEIRKKAWIRKKAKY